MALSQKYNIPTFFRISSTTSSFSRLVIRSRRFAPSLISRFLHLPGEIKQMTNITIKPDFGSDFCLLPPLPKIIKPEIERMVFTHRSFHARPTHVFEDLPNDLSPDNEKYEHLGDTVLGLVVTTLLFEMYPGLRVGPSTKIRALMVGNNTLAEISMYYKLPERLTLHHAQAVTLRSSAHIRADLFESFVGGLYLDQELEAVNKWLVPLFKPYAKAAYDAVRKQHGIPALATPIPSRQSSPCDDERKSDGQMTPAGHLALFNQHLQKSNRQVEWIYSDGDAHEYTDPGMPAEQFVKGTKATPVWYVKVIVDGEPFGCGRGTKKKFARDEAAKQGLIKLGIFVW